jgi:Membrane proteins related to metalloendopeptidases
LTVPIAGYSVKLMQGSFYQHRGTRLHYAVDMLAPRNTPVLAVESGTIGRLFNSNAGGLTIYQKSPDGKFVYYYAHLERYADNLHDGDPVARNQVIGYVGTSGNAPPNTPHLHFAISKIDGTSVFRGTPIDPFEVYNNELTAR